MGAPELESHRPDYYCHGCKTANVPLVWVGGSVDRADDMRCFQCRTCLRNALLLLNEWTDPSARELVSEFCQEVERERRYRTTKGGQHVSNHGDFASVPPSALGRLEWWAKAFEAALAKEKR